MPTAAPRPQESLTVEELHGLTASAWSEYRDGLRDLSAQDYDDAERRLWDELQSRLAELDEHRAQLAASGDDAR
jgi:hypothetical protein